MFDQILSTATPEIAALLVVVFLAAIGLVWGVASLIKGNDTVDRLDNIIGLGGGQTQQSSDTGKGWLASVANAAKPIAKFANSETDWEKSELRRRFVYAGWRGQLATELFFGSKAVLGLGLPALLFALDNLLGWEFSVKDSIILYAVAMLAGYYIPNFWLNRKVFSRQREITESFPDALDLLTICIEAGLGLDAALARVASEMRLSSSSLADEIELVTLEMRAGAGKERALRNLATRTGIEDIESTVATLVQSERFGTSIGESLRIQSDMLRSKRQLKAEEMAAKIAVKLVFPLCICILPSIFIVTAGPAMLQIGDTFQQVFGN